MLKGLGGSLDSRLLPWQKFQFDVLAITLSQCTVGQFQWFGGCLVGIFYKLIVLHMNVIVWAMPTDSFHDLNFIGVA